MHKQMVNEGVHNVDMVRDFPEFYKYQTNQNAITLSPSIPTLSFGDASGSRSPSRLPRSREEAVPAPVRPETSGKAGEEECVDGILGHKKNKKTMPKTD
jgi:hypothetical protein